MTCLFQTTPLSSDVCRDAVAPPPTPPPTKPIMASLNDAWASFSSYDLTGKLQKAHTQFQAIEWTGSLVFGITVFGAIFALMMFAFVQTMRSNGPKHDLLLWERKKRVQPPVYPPRSNPTRRYALGFLDLVVLGYKIAYDGGVYVVAKVTSATRSGMKVTRHALAVGAAGLATRLEPKT